MTASPALTRSFWEAIEPVHAVAYFAPEVAEADRDLGLRGFWMAYFAGRLAPAGAVTPKVANALCFVFAPARVERAIPDAWSYATPDQVVRTRLDAVERTLERALPPSPHLERLADLLEEAVEGCAFEGRALAAAWSGVPRPASTTGRVWLAATILREHRGDGHTMAIAHASLTGLEAGVTHVAAGAVTRELVQVSRGWTDDEWEQARSSLTARGLLTPDFHLTSEGEALRGEIEDVTDRLAAGPVAHLGPAAEEAIEIARPLSRHLVDAGLIPVPNPMGAPRP
ncbi:hypothetical protein J4573_48580 [Actinomadura barringtoniae]|uniref:SalK n=1 Tax=Actinomadura barringtoniae TaxID=1427535 RepID=A0A939T9B5_9ACTN|nr:hypothetical protein [Actinomadura barringtoniae]MBO2455018.1 hypothetical protein [Actinomadura barringtoniae]